MVTPVHTRDWHKNHRCSPDTCHRFAKREILLLANIKWEIQDFFIYSIQPFKKKYYVRIRIWKKKNKPSWVSPHYKILLFFARKAKVTKSSRKKKSSQESTNSAPEVRYASPSALLILFLSPAPELGSISSSVFLFFFFVLLHLYLTVYKRNHLFFSKLLVKIKAA